MKKRDLSIKCAITHLKLAIVQYKWNGWDVECQDSHQVAREILIAISYLELDKE